MPLAQRALSVYADLTRSLTPLQFDEPVTHVYNPLEYAEPAIRQYLERYGNREKRVLFLGMNPGPWGMAQTGVPFGEVDVVRGWLGLDATVGKPPREHPKRPVSGLACERSEVSGKRLWGLFAARYATPGAFFDDHLVLNHCPLVFMEESGRNRTPDKLPPAEREPLLQACDQALADLIDLYRPACCIGVGGFAEKRLRKVCGDTVTVGRLLHPSPASPLANRGWAAQATAQLIEQGIWIG